MCLLLLVQFVAIAFDVAIAFMDFAGYLQLKFIVFSFAYAVKLELEFVALNQLVELSKMGFVHFQWRRWDQAKLHRIRDLARRKARAIPWIS
jgi:hypothetical protein